MAIAGIKQHVKGNFLYSEAQEFYVFFYCICLVSVSGNLRFPFFEENNKKSKKSVCMFLYPISTYSQDYFESKSKL